MRNIKLTIEYDGTDYCGWQSQINGPSIQDFVEKALRGFLHERVKVIGAARTDSGVHAKCQVANFKTTSKLALKNIQKAINGNLPKDIVIVGIKRVDEGFHAQFSAKSKIYRYAIYNREERSPFFDKFSVRVPLKLDIEAMKKGTRPLLGRHDFSSFKGSKGVTKTQVRTIKKVSIKRRNNFIIIDIEANGFLYNMVRNIVGTLIEIGRGKVKPAGMKKILSARDRSKAGPTAPARGLTLIRVEY
ncbi:MAG: tRNA pseudouridine(38-40) synthase TruA [Candidatus Omnitrophica bacterium]|nr:tRNA pseudouridine(38-40) synthase TruA [Candidatus Omnitrophota bacterium]